jgi:UDP-2,4-diacetamido-2,4,6-trideoxy-beta-L-altropyranose hydrolase
MTPKLVIRADSTSKIGTGHVMRSLALAQACDVKSVVFIGHCETSNLRNRIESAGIQYISLDRIHPEPEDLEMTLNILKNIRIENDPLLQHWVLLDGYHFTSDYQLAMRKAGYRVLVIDDLAHLKQYHADILLNQNAYAGRLRYNCDADTLLLLGSKYVLLRSDFRKWKGWKKKISENPQRILITLGGSDPGNLTTKVIRALGMIDFPDLEVAVIIGALNSHLSQVEKELASLSLRSSLLLDVIDMSRVLAWADVCLIGAGTTCLEAAFMGVPSILLVAAENQILSAKELERAGVAINLGWYQNVSQEQIAKAITNLLRSPMLIKEMSGRGQKLIDGEGTSRVVELIHEQRIRLRKARRDDCELLWKWANDPEIRGVSFSPEPIPWEHHVSWFSSKLNDSNCVHLIATDINGPIGQARFDINEDEARISVSVDGAHRGKNKGTSIIRLASNRLIEESTVQLINAYVKQSNGASVVAFTKAGYRLVRNFFVHGVPVLHLVYERGQHGSVH